jgi:TldD protein
VRRLTRLMACAFLLLGTGPLHGDEPATDEPLVRAMRDELRRSAEQLRLPDAAKPYYLAFRVNDQTRLDLAASFGALTVERSTRGRYLRVDVRVGDYALDNSNFFARSDFGTGGLESLPIEDDYDAMRHDIWHATDLAYKQAAATYAKKLATRKTQADSPDDAGDFSREAPSHIVVRRAVAVPELDRAASLVKELSALARAFPEIHGSEVQLTAVAGRQIYMSSESSFTDEDDAVVTLTATLWTQAPDGMPLTRVVSFTAPSLESLPARDLLERDFNRAARDLSEARRARAAEDYTGPLLFEPHAAAQLVRDVLAPQLSGTPAPKSDMGNNSNASPSETEWTGRIGQRVLSAGLRIEDDPTIDRFGTTPLVGHYAADDEGMPGQRVSLIDKGILERFVMSRTPRKGFDHSNGHGRAPFFLPAAGSISNLVVTAAHGASAADLRSKLLAEARAAGLLYGLVVRELDDTASGGEYGAIFGRRSSGHVGPPLALFRIAADGSEEPLRGATFGPFSLSAFEEIVAAGTEQAVISRAVGTPTSVVCPALLFKRIEIKKPAGPQRRPPILSHPYFAEKQP